MCIDSTQIFTNFLQAIVLYVISVFDCPRQKPAHVRDKLQAFVLHRCRTKVGRQSSRKVNILYFGHHHIFLGQCKISTNSIESNLTYPHRTPPLLSFLNSMSSNFFYIPSSGIIDIGYRIQKSVFAFTTVCQNVRSSKLFPKYLS